MDEYLEYLIEEKRRMYHKLYVSTGRSEIAFQKQDEAYERIKLISQYHHHLNIIAILPPELGSRLIELESVYYSK